ncbi:MAG: helix-turn-helix transcriptional regulator [Cyclobacteriaceae bacterium]
MSQIFKNILDSLSRDVKRYVELSDEIAEHIYSILEERGMSQKDLATELGKKESEISKWLSGSHNFTLKSIAKLETVLECDLLFTGKKVKEIKTPIDINWSVSVPDIYEGSLKRNGSTLDDYDDDDFSFVDTEEAA